MQIKIFIINCMNNAIVECFEVIPFNHNDSVGKHIAAQQHLKLINVALITCKMEYGSL